MFSHDIPFYRHKIFKWLLDTTTSLTCLIFALFFRLGHYDFNEINSQALLSSLALIPVCLSLASVFFRTYTNSWRYFSTQDLRGFFGFYTSFIALFLLSNLLTRSILIIPRSSLLLFCLMTFFGMTSLRIFYKLKRELYPHQKHKSDTSIKDDLIYVGALEGLDSWVKGINLHRGSLSYNIVGAVGLRKTFAGVYVKGIPIIGSIENLKKATEKALEKENIRGFIINLNANDNATSTLNTVSNVASHFGLKLYKIPTPEELEGTSKGPQHIQSVEIGDLLGRKQRNFNSKEVGSIVKAKTVLVTGAGGSIGSELVKQISSFDVKEIILVENSEYNLYGIENWLKNKRPELNNKIVYCFADIRDKNKLDDIFSKYKPEVVYHAAALKHVPLMEDNQIECIKTNVFGTKNIVDCALAHSTKQFTMISTDKAVHPENIMGFTKRIAEIYCQSAKQSHHEIIFRIVRFGNVLGSSGSVIPLFTSQIKEGGPVTVTHIDTTRFFMTIPEAVQLVLQTGYINKKSNTDIFVLEMGEPIKILHLAKKMIRLSGLQPYIDIPIDIIGLRPGEKLHEELYLETSSMKKTNIEGILVTNSLSAAQPLLISLLDELKQQIYEANTKNIIEQLSLFAPEHKLKISDLKNTVNIQKGIHAKNNFNIQ